ncbi:GntR family transcriptional regulator [Jeotgalibaca ciconiae]|uniref:GntR family transcriptional regulator n=1 Tax=Jeotgalibaca ciconiae TaxID=2496265 RepID=A0A3Q9BJ63_9LACT|nr:GntR family transcriptional regulator [Jeotgalibaca ciconiae]
MYKQEVEQVARIFNYQNVAYQVIKDLILKSDLVPDQKVSKKDLTQLLGIGDTPVREAIIQLREEGLLRVVPQSGTFVSKINLQEVKEARFVRQNIERLVVEEAFDKIKANEIQELENKVTIQQAYKVTMQHDYMDTGNHDIFFKLDEEFHEFFYQIANKRHVWEWMQMLNISLNRYRYLRIELKDLSWDGIIEEHENIVTLIKEGKKKELGEQIVAHLDMFDKDVDIVINAFPEYFDLEGE